MELVRELLQMAFIFGLPVPLVYCRYQIRLPPLIVLDVSEEFIANDLRIALDVANHRKYVGVLRGYFVDLDSSKQVNSVV